MQEGTALLPVLSEDPFPSVTIIPKAQYVIKCSPN
jgi:hypothetical protein